MNNYKLFYVPSLVTWRIIRKGKIASEKEAKRLLIIICRYLRIDENKLLNVFDCPERTIFHLFTHLLGFSSETSASVDFIEFDNKLHLFVSFSSVPSLDDINSYLDLFENDK